MLITKQLSLKIRHAVFKKFQQLYKIFEQLFQFWATFEQLFGIFLSNFLAFSEQNLERPTVAPPPQTSLLRFFLGGWLSDTYNPSSNCPSKLTDKVRWIVHSKLKPFHFQIKTYYLITYLTRIIKRITRLTRIIRLESEDVHVCYKWMSRPRPWDGPLRHLLFLFHKDYF